MVEARHGMVFHPLWPWEECVWVAAMGLVLQVLHIHLCGCFICPFEVAGLAKRYFHTECASRCGAPLRNPVLIALMKDAMGGLQKPWCANLTLLALLVHV
jgi:hypothetical protein